MLPDCRRADNRLEPFGHTRTALGRLSGALVANRAADMPVLSPSSARGVGHNPDPRPLMFGADGGSRYAVPFNTIPEPIEAPEHGIPSARSKLIDVFGDDRGRLCFFDKPEHFKPKSRSLAGKSGVSTIDTDVLAGEAAADDIGNNSVCAKARGVEGFDVIANRYSRPMLRQHAAAVWVDLAECDSLKSASALKPEAEPTDARE